MNNASAPHSRDSELNLVLVGALFACTSPLVAFSFYFALLHTPRALAGLSPSLAGDPAARWRAVLATVLALVLASLLFVANRHVSIGDDLVRTIFMLLAALTVSHMWLETTAPDFRSGKPALVLTPLVASNPQEVRCASGT